MNTNELEEALRELANGVEVPPVDTTSFVRRGTRIRRRRLAVATTACVALIALIAAGASFWPKSSRQAVSAAGRTATVPSMTAADLVRGSWTELPSAPLSPRVQSVVVWAGDEMLVWGGASEQANGTLFNDGATYNPRLEQWRPVPDSPLSPRASSTAVWTGTEVVIWGGITSSDFKTASNDGAAFNPSTGQWRMLPASPLSPRSSVEATWTGHDVVVFGGVTPTNLSGEIDGASYDLEADRWTKLPAAPIARHQLDYFKIVWAGDRLVIANAWATEQKIDANTSTADSGIDFFTLTSDDRWSEVPKSDQTPRGLSDLIWTGSAVLAPAAGTWSGLASNPFSSARPGRQLDVSAGVWTPIASGPVDDGQGVTVWTGDALFHVASSFDGGPKPINPGDTEVWDPSADTWSRAPSAPDAAMGTAVWTGHEVLIWSELYDSSTKEMRAHGLRFGPGAVATTSSTDAAASSTSAPSTSAASATTETTIEAPSTSSTADTTPKEAAACADAAPDPVPAHQRDGTDQSFVPGTPARVLGCRYHGLNQPQPVGSLAASAEMNPDQMAQLANASQRLDPNAIYHCPMDAGEKYFLRFVYENGPDLLVRIDGQGCRIVNNGDIQGFATEDLMNALHSALGADPR